MYKLTNSMTVFHLTENAFIPADERNTDYRQYLVWLAEGNTPEPADTSPTPVITVTPWQIRKALNALDLRESVEAAVAGSDVTTIDAWQYATEFVRTDPLVVAVGTALGKTDEELDSLFSLAQSL